MKTTAILLTVTMITLGIYDAYVVTFSGVDASISRYLQQTMFSSPIFSFGLGAIFGHVALYFKPRWKNPELIVAQMSKRLVETNQMTITNGKFYWKENNVCLDGQENS